MNQGIDPDLFIGWSARERKQFSRDWSDDSFLHYHHETPERVGNLCEPLSAENRGQLQQNQVGERKQKRVEEDGNSKRTKAEEYFTSRPTKQVNVRNVGMFNTYSANL